MDRACLLCCSRKPLALWRKDVGVIMPNGGVGVYWKYAWTHDGREQVMEEQSGQLARPVSFHHLVPYGPATQLLELPVTVGRPADDPVDLPNLDHR